MPVVVPDTGSDPDPSYAVAAQLLGDLPARVASERARRGLSIKQAATAIGVTAATLTGLEGGSNCTRATATAVLRWLAT